MDRANGLVTAGFIATVIAYAILSGRWVRAEPGWYAGLAKPSWQPPDWVFGVAWPYSFLALGVAGYALGSGSPVGTSGRILALLVTSVALALAWAYLFYVPHRLVAAAVCLGLAALPTWTVVVLAWRAIPWTGAVLVPYAGWLTIATSLAVGYANLRGRSRA